LKKVRDKDAGKRRGSMGKESKEKLLEREAFKGLAQIKEREYFRKLKGKTHLYGMAFWKKDSCVRMETHPSD
jgi:hypothetical protein